MIDPARHSFVFVPAPPALAPYLNSLYVLRIEAGELNEMLPAYSGQLLLAPRGEGRLDCGSGLVEAPARSFVIGPLSSARRIAIDGPALMLGASFNFHGWAALTRLPVANYGDRFIDVQTALGTEAGERLLALTGEIDGDAESLEEPLKEIAEILQDRLKPLSPAHAELVTETYAWLGSSLNPDCADLFARLPLSERQVQRLVKRFFGLSPSRLKRRYRAIRAATMLSDAGLDWEQRQKVIDSFYDQAHMIREIREFTGRTPRILSRGGEGLTADTLGKDGYGVAKLFADEGADEEDEQPSPNAPD